MASSSKDATQVESTPLLGDQSSESRRLKAAIVAVLASYAASTAKTFIDRAVDVTEAHIARLHNAPLVLSTLPGLGTAFYAVGKVFAVIYAHRFGGKPLHLVPLVGLAACALFILSNGSTLGYFVAWLTFRVVAAWTWPATLAVMVAWVDGQHHGLGSTGLGFAWEFATLLSTLIYTALYTDSAQYHVPFVVSICVCVLSSLIMALFLRDSPKEQGYRPALPATLASTPPTAAKDAPQQQQQQQQQQPTAHAVDEATVWTALNIFLSDPSYLLVMTGSSCGLMTQYLLQYLPSWAAVALGTSSSEASAVIVVFAAGSVTGVLVGGKLHDMLGPRGRLWTVMLFAVIVGLGGMALPIVFAVTGREHFTIRSIIGFLPPVAFAGAILNYITCTVYFAQVGGKKHTATAATVADVLGIGASAIVQLIAGQMMDHENYLGVLVLLGGTSVGMAGCFMLFAYSVYYDGVREKGTTASALDAVPDR